MLSRYFFTIITTYYNSNSFHIQSIFRTFFHNNLFLAITTIMSRDQIATVFSYLRPSIYNNIYPEEGICDTETR